jgi:hypothetical protein
MSSKSFYQVLYRCTNAILQIDELSYHFPSSDEECNAAAASFSKISSHSFIRGCVGCIDGLLIRVTSPREKDTPDAKAFFLDTTRITESNAALFMLL